METSVAWKIYNVVLVICSGLIVQFLTGEQHTTLYVGLGGFLAAVLCHISERK